jgi:hypothetical protein
MSSLSSTIRQHWSKWTRTRDVRLALASAAGTCGGRNSATRALLHIGFLFAGSKVETATGAFVARSALLAGETDVAWRALTIFHFQSDSFLGVSLDSHLECHVAQAEICRLCRRSHNHLCRLYYARLQYAQFKVSFVMSYRVMSKWFSHFIYYLNLRHFVQLDLVCTWRAVE